MENLWTKINDDVPMYMKKICEKYHLVCVKISSIKTALVGKKFALIIAIDRFDASVYYLHMEGKEIKIYFCDFYFGQKYDADDRGNLLEGKGAEIEVRNNLIIIASGLLNKWGNVLSGEKEWLEDYKKSNWCFEERSFLPEEIEKIMICARKVFGVGSGISSLKESNHNKIKCRDQEVSWSDIDGGPELTKWMKDVEGGSGIEVFSSEKACQELEDNIAKAIATWDAEVAGIQSLSKTQES